MNCKPFFIFLFLICIVLTALTCKKEPPVVPPSPPPSGPDTTSHNFTFTQYTFGGAGGSSYFKDVAIINDTDIWAVGAIYTAADTTYNAAHWNGRAWSLKKISANFRGNFITTTMEGIFAFSSTDIWLAASDPIHGDGQNWVDYDIRSIPGYDSLSVSKCWGTTSNMMYFVGRGGSIIRYNGTTWTKQSSGTTIDLRDVWGTADGSVVWACGYSNDNSQSVLLKYDGSSWQTVWSSHPSAPPYGGLIISLWGGQHLYLAGTDGIFRQAIAGEDSVVHLFSLTHFPYRLKGSSENNIAFVGDFGMIWHYNGTDWKQLNETALDQPLYSVAVSTNAIVSVGSDYSSFPNTALIYVGRRQ